MCTINNNFLYPSHNKHVKIERLHYWIFFPIKEYNIIDYIILSKFKSCRQKVKCDILEKHIYFYFSF